MCRKKKLVRLQLDSKSDHVIITTLEPDFHDGDLVSFSVATKQEAIVKLNK